MAASEYEPERLVEAVEELHRRVEELRDLARAWEKSLREEAQGDAVPGMRPPPPDLQGADALLRSPDRGCAWRRAVRDLLR